MGGGGDGRAGGGGMGGACSLSLTSLGPRDSSNTVGASLHPGDKEETVSLSRRKPVTSSLHACCHDPSVPNYGLKG